MIAELPFPWRYDGTQYSDLYLMRQVTEAQVQADILALMRAYRVDAVPIDAGGRRQRGRMMGAAKAAGMDLAGIQNVKTGAAIPSGYADLEATLAPKGRSLYIEVKAPAWHSADHRVIRAAGVPSKEQLEFLFSKHKRGAIVLVAWSSDDVMKVIGPELQFNLGAL